jgi:HNH endonuclease
MITFKPASESPEHGFPLEDYRRVVRNRSNGDPVRWRFRNKHVAMGERVFLLLQGNGGPAIVPIRFENLVDPTESPALVSKETLLRIQGGERFWRINFSGVRLTDAIGARLEALVVGTESKADSDAINDLGSDAPNRVPTSILRYARDPRIREAVKRRAEGKCELCGQVSFIGLDGKSYLESHHVIALAREGADRMTNVIALCPRDHREAHFGQRGNELEEEMIRKLQIIGARV